MDKNYREIMLKMDSIMRQLYEIGEIAEHANLFPVRSYINFQDNWQDFYQDLRGAIKKVDEINKARDTLRKMYLNSIYGISVTAYADTDSIKRRVDSDGHQD